MALCRRLGRIRFERTVIGLWKATLLTLCRQQSRRRESAHATAVIRPYCRRKQPKSVTARAPHILPHNQPRREQSEIKVNLRFTVMKWPLNQFVPLPSPTLVEALLRRKGWLMAALALLVAVAVL